jgi:creatinine amidohydrolase
MLFMGPDMRQEKDGRDYYGMDILSFPNATPKQLDGSAYWMEEELFEQLLERILRQLKRAGFKVVVAHGHGPSTKTFARLGPRFEEQFVLKTFCCWRADEKDGLGVQTDHAAANETSLMMALHPDLVAMDNLDQNPEVAPLGVGGKDPRVHASAARGQQILASNVERMAALIEEALKK